MNSIFTLFPSLCGPLAARHQVEPYDGKRHNKYRLKEGDKFDEDGDSIMISSSEIRAKPLNQSVSITKNKQKELEDEIFLLTLEVKWKNESLLEYQQQLLKCSEDIFLPYQYEYHATSTANPTPLLTVLRNTLANKPIAYDISTIWILLANAIVNFHELLSHYKEYPVGFDSSSAYNHNCFTSVEYAFIFTDILFGAVIRYLFQQLSTTDFALFKGYSIIKYIKDIILDVVNITHYITEDIQHTCSVAIGHILLKLSTILEILLKKLETMLLHNPGRFPVYKTYMNEYLTLLVFNHGQITSLLKTLCGSESIHYYICHLKMWQIYEKIISFLKFLEKSYLKYDIEYLTSFVIWEKQLFQCFYQILTLQLSSNEFIYELQKINQHAFATSTHILPGSLVLHGGACNRASLVRPTGNPLIMKNTASFMTNDNVLLSMIQQCYEQDFLPSSFRLLSALTTPYPPTKTQGHNMYTNPTTSQSAGNRTTMIAHSFVSPNLFDASSSSATAPIGALLAAMPLKHTISFHLRYLLFGLSKYIHLYPLPQLAITATAVISQRNLLLPTPRLSNHAVVAASYTIPQLERLNCPNKEKTMTTLYEIICYILPQFHPPYANTSLINEQLFVLLPFLLSLLLKLSISISKEDVSHHTIQWIYQDLAQRLNGYIEWLKPRYHILKNVNMPNSNNNNNNSRSNNKSVCPTPKATTTSSLSAAAQTTNERLVNQSHPGMCMSTPMRSTTTTTNTKNHHNNTMIAATPIDMAFDSPFKELQPTTTTTNVLIQQQSQKSPKVVPKMNLSAALMGSPSNRAGKSSSMTSSTSLPPVSGRSTTSTNSAAVGNIVYQVGDIIDGLCTLPNGTQRWYPGKIAEMKWNQTNDRLLYTVQYHDGDMGHDMTESKIRKPKRGGALSRNPSASNILISSRNNSHTNIFATTATTTTAERDTITPSPSISPPDNTTTLSNNNNTTRTELSAHTASSFATPVGKSLDSSLYAASFAQQHQQQSSSSYSNGEGGGGGLMSSISARGTFNSPDFVVSPYSDKSRSPVMKRKYIVPILLAPPDMIEEESPTITTTTNNTGNSIKSMRKQSSFLAGLNIPTVEDNFFDTEGEREDNEDDLSDDDDEDRIYEIPSIFDNHHRNTTTSTSTSTVSSTKAETVVPRMHFGNLPLTSSLPHMMSSPSLSGALLPEIPQDSSRGMGNAFNGGSSYMVMNSGRSSGDGSFASPMVTGTIKFSARNGTNPSSASNNSSFYTNRNSGGGGGTSRSAHIATHRSSINLSTHRSTVSTSEYDVDLMESSRSNSKSTAILTFRNSMNATPTAMMMSGGQRGTNIPYSASPENITEDYLSMRRTSTDSNTNTYPTMMMVDQYAHFEDRIVGTGGGNGGNSSTNTRPSVHRPMIPPPQEILSARHSVHSHPLGPGLGLTGGSISSAAPSILYYQDYFPISDQELQYIDVLTPIYAFIVKILLSQCLSSDNHLNEQYYQPPVDPLVMSNITHVTEVYESFYTQQPPQQQQQQGSNNGNTIAHNMLFLFREFLEYCPIEVVKQDILSFCSYYYQFQGLQRLCKLLNASFFATCLLEHAQDASCAVKIGEGGFGNIFRVKCKCCSREDRDTDRRSVGTYYQYSHCYTCYQTRNPYYKRKKIVSTCHCWRSDAMEKVSGFVRASFFHPGGQQQRCGAATIMNNNYKREPPSFAIKRIPRERSAYDQSMIVKIYSEILCLEKCQSCIGICGLEDYGVTGSEYWIVLENGLQNVLEWRQQFTPSPSNVSSSKINCSLRTNQIVDQVRSFYNKQTNNNAVNKSTLLNEGNADSTPSSNTKEEHASSSSSSSMNLPHLLVLCLLYLDMLSIIYELHHVYHIVHYDLKCTNWMIREEITSDVLLTLLQCHMNGKLAGSQTTNKPMLNHHHRLSTNAMSGVIFLIDFGESIYNIEQYTEAIRTYEANMLEESEPQKQQAVVVAAAYSTELDILRKSRGTLPIQSPEMICITDNHQSDHDNDVWNQNNLLSQSFYQTEKLLQKNFWESPVANKHRHSSAPSSASKARPGAKLSAAAVEHLEKQLPKKSLSKFASNATTNATNVNGSKAAGGGSISSSSAAVAAAAAAITAADGRANRRNKNRFPIPTYSSDIWSLGCLFIELLCGKMFFENQSWPELFTKLCIEIPMQLDFSFLVQSLRDIPEIIRKKLLTFLSQTLQQQPSDRMKLPQMIIAMKEMIQIIIEQLCNTSNPTNPIVSTSSTSNGVRSSPPPVVIIAHEDTEEDDLVSSLDTSKSKLSDKLFASMGISWLKIASGKDEMIGIPEDILRLSMNTWCITETLITNMLDMIHGYVYSYNQSNFSLQSDSEYVPYNPSRVLQRQPSTKNNTIRSLGAVGIAFGLSGTSLSLQQPPQLQQLHHVGENISSYTLGIHSTAATTSPNMMHTHHNHHQHTSPIPAMISTAATSTNPLDIFTAHFEDIQNEHYRLFLPCCAMDSMIQQTQFHSIVSPYDSMPTPVVLGKNNQDQLIDLLQHTMLMKHIYRNAKGSHILWIQIQCVTVSEDVAFATTTTTGGVWDGKTSFSDVLASESNPSTPMTDTGTLYQSNPGNLSPYSKRRVGNYQIDIREAYHGLVTIITLTVPILIASKQQSLPEEIVPAVIPAVSVVPTVIPTISAVIPVVQAVIPVVQLPAAGRVQSPLLTKSTSSTMVYSPPHPHHMASVLTDMSKSNTKISFISGSADGEGESISVSGSEQNMSVLYDSSSKQPQPPVQPLQSLQSLQSASHSPHEAAVLPPTSSTFLTNTHWNNTTNNTNNNTSNVSTTNTNTTVKTNTNNSSEEKGCEIPSIGTNTTTTSSSGNSGDSSSGTNSIGASGCHIHLDSIVQQIQAIHSYITSEQSKHTMHTTMTPPLTTTTTTGTTTTSGTTTTTTTGGVADQPPVSPMAKRDHHLPLILFSIPAVASMTATATTTTTSTSAPPSTHTTPLAATTGQGGVISPPTVIISPTDTECYYSSGTGTGGTTGTGNSGSSGNGTGSSSDTSASSYAHKVALQVGLFCAYDCQQATSSHSTGSHTRYPSNTTSSASTTTTHYDQVMNDCFQSLRQRGWTEEMMDYTFFQQLAMKLSLPSTTTTGTTGMVGSTIGGRK